MAHYNQTAETQRTLKSVREVTHHRQRIPNNIISRFLMGNLGRPEDSGLICSEMAEGKKPANQNSFKNEGEISIFPGKQKMRKFKKC